MLQFIRLKVRHPAKIGLPTSGVKPLCGVSNEPLLYRRRCLLALAPGYLPLTCREVQEPLLLTKTEGAPEGALSVLKEPRQ